MLTTYTYVKSLNHKTVSNVISKDAIFSQDIFCIKLQEPSLIEITFTVALTGSEELRLDTVIDSLVDVDPDILIDKNMQKISKFTEKLVREYGKKNLKRGYTESQVRTMTNDLAEITRLLDAKALPTVLDVLSTFAPTSEITSEDVSDFTNDIIEFLGKL